LVMHGGSGSTQEEIQTAVSAGVVKMNIDTDTQWAYWQGVRDFEAKNKKFLQSQIGNPTGADKPNKKYYDPRKWIREAEMSMATRVAQSIASLGSGGQFKVQDGKGTTQIYKVDSGKMKGMLEVTTGVVIGATLAMLFTKVR